MTTATNSGKFSRIPGGYNAFCAAVNAGYSEPMHNPCIRWSLSKGFTAESDLYDSDDDQFVLERCNYDANSGTAWIGTTHAEYRHYRQRILAFQNTLDSTNDRALAMEAVDDVKFLSDN